MIVDVIIPAFNEEEAVGHVVRDIPKELVREVVVVNNASSDRTRQRAEEAGATVLDQPLRGYGNACLMGIAHLRDKERRPDVVVFLDGDHSDHPEELPRLLAPIAEDQADLVIGSRALGTRERGSMTPQQVFGNRLACTLMRWLYGVHYTDLGPFRAIRWEALEHLGMEDRNYGWTVEMQVKAARQRLPYAEVPVDYRRRIGFSKVSGTLKGTIMAGYKIIATIFKYR
ncbi:MAG: glycosyltransferase family 2 protein [Flavobacteriales bacterium]|nr:glycosyltransferase family 2 protein [Flavobacteriales bacterium]